MGQIKKLVITIDIDNDFLKIPLENGELKWNGLIFGLPIVLDSINLLAKNEKKKLSITIFCRADWQIEETMGDACWVFEETQKVLSRKKFENLNIALEWHPHLYQKSSNGKWELAFDPQVQENQLLDVFDKLRKRNINFVCSRIGECYFSSTILRTLEGLKISIDSTAFSGRNIGHTDWSLAPTRPYRPDINDFTKSGKCSLLMAPFTMIPIEAPYESKSSLRYLNLIFDPKFTRDGINNYPENVFITILHPFEILTLDQPNKHQLFGSFDSITKNLKYILELSSVESILLRNLK